MNDGVSDGMSDSPERRRWLRRMLSAGGALLLAGCDRLSESEHVADLLRSAQHLSRYAHKIVPGRQALAQEFSPADVSPEFRANGTRMPGDADYRALLRGGFADWRLAVGGLVERPLSFSLAELRAMPARSQITRHDCVEGWSCIGQWKGVPLAHVLSRVKPLKSAQFVVFHCADSMDEGPGDSRYYESIDLDDAYHPQTVLAYEMNGRTLPVAHGAPLRLRVERQLGYKHAKYLMRLELVDSFERLRGGRGGYWEDEGYEWNAGI